MTKHSTKRALLMSCLSLLLCLSMLVGTTFAWFTDTVSTGVNTIVAGNLDIVLEYMVFDEDGNGTWEEVTEESLLFDKDARYEPGYTEVAYLKVSNAGTLALTYRLAVAVANEVAGTNVYDESFKLSDYLEFGVIRSLTEIEPYADRAAAQKAVEGNTTKLQSYMNEADLLPGEAFYIALVVYMPTTVENEANYKTGTTPPSLHLGVNLFATQADYEFDTYDDKYDVGAFEYDGDLEDYVETVPDATDPEKITKVIIHNAAGLMAFAEKFGTEETKDVTTVEIAADIDLAGYDWKAINAWDPENGAVLTIDGQGHTISNMTAEGGSKLGFIGANARDIVIQNLTFDNANVTTSGSMAGIVIGYQYGDVVLNNVDVTNSTVKTTAEKGIRIGGLVGQSFLQDGATLTITDCDIDNLEVSGYHNVAGMVGSLMNYSTLTDKWEITNSTVKNSAFVVTSASLSNESYFSAVACEGGNYGEANKYTNDGVNFAGVETENNTFGYTQEIVKDGLYYDGETYTVESAEGFVYLTNKISSDFAGKTVALAADLDFGTATVAEEAETWKTIATFAGTFDGQGHTISNLNERLFYTINGTVKNLKVANVNVAYTTNLDGGSGFARYMSGAVENCEFSNITVSTTARGKWMAGLFSEVSGKITGCTVNGLKVIANGATAKIDSGAGGFAGTVKGGAVITDCTLNDVVVDADYANNAGGVFGKVGQEGQASITLKNITVNGLTMEVGNTDVTTTTIANVGGFIGQCDYRTNDSRLTIDNCHINDLDMTITSNKNGEDPTAGFISSLNGGADITNCSVDGKINGTQEPLGVGGFLGTIGGHNAKNAYVVNITNCVADVEITGNDTNYVGGFVAYSGSRNKTITLTLNFTNCEAKGSFYGKLETGTNEVSTFTGCKVDGADFAG